MTHPAEVLTGKGFAVFPIRSGAKYPPIWRDWPNRATKTPDSAHWPPGSNTGIHCKGLLVVDVDVKKGGGDSLTFLKMVHDLPDTLTSLTPSGGQHLFYRLPEGHPGVANRVQGLGKGLDVRSTGGYVVAPGSALADGGEYRFENPDAEMAPAPEWLILKSGTFVPKSGTNEAVPDAGDAVYERAMEWLAGQAPAAEGQGGDARTFVVAAGLRDMGVSEAQALELLPSWNERCEPPWDPADLAVKVANAYRYAENEPGARAALPEDFPIIEGAKLAKRAPVNTRALRLSEFANSATRGAGYVVKGLMQRRSYAEIFGSPGAGKTFVALDMAYHVAAGTPWMDRKVHPGPVLYLAYEGTGGLIKRAHALRQKYGTADVPLYISSATFNLREATGRNELGALMAELPAKPVLIVIDTFARALMGGDENSAQDVGAFNGGVAALIENTGACVCIIHHSGKDKSKGARGSSALLGAIDTEIEVDAGQVCARKQRDMEVSAPIGFKLAPVVVGIDDDGDEETSCVVEPAAVPAGPMSKRITGNAKRGFDALCALSPGNEPVSQGAWRDACRDFLSGKAVDQRFYDIKRSLLDSGHITVDSQGLISRRLE
jgi:hypothetical protein